MKKFLVLFLVLFACTAYAQGIPSPSTPRLMADDAGNYVSQSYPLPVSIGGADSAAIEAIKAELLSVGTAVDTIASSSEAIDNNTKQCSKFEVQVVTLTANTSHLLVSGLTGDRKFVEIKSHLPNQQFWVSFTDTAAINLCRPCTEYFYAEVPSNVAVAIIAASAMTLSVVEGGL